MTPVLVVRVERLLVGRQWNPEQIAHRLNLEDGTCVSHASTYQHIWKDKLEGGRLYLHLRQQGKKRNKRSGKNAGRRMIPGRVDIKERPKIVEEKIRLGDWELDSVIGAKHKGAITSLVERKTKFTKFIILKDSTTDTTCKGIIKRLTPRKEHVLTLTSDNGQEFAGHKKISKNSMRDSPAAPRITPGSVA